jgi:hypothetical protein
MTTLTADTPRAPEPEPELGLSIKVRFEAHYTVDYRVTASYHDATIAALLDAVRDAGYEPVTTPHCTCIIESTLKWAHSIWCASVLARPVSA